MATRHRSRSMAGLLVALVVAGILGGAVPASAHAAGLGDVPRLAGPVQAADLTKDVCAVVSSQPVSSAAEELLSKGRGLLGSLLAQVVVTAVTNNCERLIRKATSVARSILATFRPPRTPQYSSLSSYLNQLAARRVSTMANQLGVPADYVQRARNAVCNAVARNQNAAQVIANNFGRARLAHLTAMNAFVRMVVNECPGLTRADANYISGAVLNLVLGNTFGQDLDPPVVHIYRTAGTRVGGGTAVVTAWFQMFDSTGVRSCDIDLWYDGAWHSRSGSCASHSARLNVGTRYAWAFRATDVTGYTSQWAVTFTGTA